jgi:hypothetical protein
MRDYQVPTQHNTDSASSALPAKPFHHRSQPRLLRDPSNAAPAPRRRERARGTAAWEVVEMLVRSRPVQGFMHMLMAAGLGSASQLSKTDCHEPMMAMTSTRSPCARSSGSCACSCVCAKLSPVRVRSGLTRLSVCCVLQFFPLRE